MGATLAATAATTVTIADDDPLPALSITDATVTEADTTPVTMTFTVSLSAVSGRAVTVVYATAGNSATQGSDYGAVAGTLTFPAGTTSQTIAVTVNGDLWHEATETFFVTLSAPSNATLADGQGLGTIIDNDPVTTPPVLDFNRDGSPDLVFRHATSGYNALWYLSGATQIGTTYLLPQGAGGADVLADLNWKIKAVGDFSGDDKPDLLWQNDANGQLAVWTFDNATRTNTSYLTLLSGQLGEPDTNWKVVGAADMNGDGHLDLVWWNQATTALRLWHMDGILQLDSVAVSVSTNDPQWQVVGVADLNGDNWPDLIWRHYGNGGLATWFMYDATRLDTRWLSPDINSDVQWRVVGVVDMNADGKPDLVWQHAGNGQLGVWYLNGTTQTGTSYLTPSAVADINWRIVGVR